MKPIHDFLNANLILKIKKFMNATDEVCRNIKEGEKTPNAALILKRQCAVVLGYLQQIGSEENINSKLTDEPLFGVMQKAFAAMKGLGANPKIFDLKSVKLIKDFVREFDSSFYAELATAVKDEVRATAGIVAVVIPQSKIIDGIKTVLGDRGASGKDYAEFMKSLFDRAFLISLSDKIAEIE